MDKRKMFVTLGASGPGQFGRGRCYEMERNEQEYMDYYQDSQSQGYQDSYQRGGRQDSYRQNSPPLFTEKIVTERKQFFLDLKENNRGRVLKITEDVHGRRDTIMVPAEALQDFHDAIGRILEFDQSGV